MLWQSPSASAVLSVPAVVTGALVPAGTSSQTGGSFQRPRVATSLAPDFDRLSIWGADDVHPVWLRTGGCSMVNYRRPRWTDPSPSVRRQHRRTSSRTSSRRCSCATARCSARITFGAHTANMAEGGLPGERHIGYYVERALGGAGMIVVEPVPTHRTAVLTRGNFRHGDDAVVPHFRRLTEAVHEAARDDDHPAAVPRRPARRRGELVRAELVAEWAAELSRCRRQPCDDRNGDRGVARRLRRAPRAAPSSRASTASRCSPPITP